MAGKGRLYLDQEQTVKKSSRSIREGPLPPVFSALNHQVFQSDEERKEQHKIVQKTGIAEPTCLKCRIILQKPGIHKPSMLHLH